MTILSVQRVLEHVKLKMMEGTHRSRDSEQTGWFIMFLGILAKAGAECVGCWTA